MARQTWLTLLLAASIENAGCGRNQESASPPGNRQPPASAATTAVVDAADVPSTHPAATAPATCEFWIDQAPQLFPSARLVLTSPSPVAAPTDALFFSEDPPEAINENYRGNSFYFEMNALQSDDPQSAVATWIYRANDSTLHDSISGIFLDGKHWQVQPNEVRIDLDATAIPARVRISGTFFMFNTQTPLQPGKLVTVRGEISAQLKSSAR